MFKSQPSVKLTTWLGQGRVLKVTTWTLLHDLLHLLHDLLHETYYINITTWNIWNWIQDSANALTLENLILRITYALHITFCVAHYIMHTNLWQSTCRRFFSQTRWTSQAHILKSYHMNLTTWLTTFTTFTTWLTTWNLLHEHYYANKMDISGTHSQMSGLFENWNLFYLRGVAGVMCQGCSLN